LVLVLVLVLETLDGTKWKEANACATEALLHPGRFNTDAAIGPGQLTTAQLSKLQQELGSLAKV
jgi:hypothetical protein